QKNAPDSSHNPSTNGSPRFHTAMAAATTEHASSVISRVRTDFGRPFEETSSAIFSDMTGIIHRRVARSGIVLRRLPYTRESVGLTTLYRSFRITEQQKAARRGYER